MYLQITERCNMTCAHCAFACTKKGKDMDLWTFQQAMSFMEEYGTECVTIGGGEPTLHPEFFEILKRCLWNFDSVWMATNGSQTVTMLRLASIMDGEDYPECDCEEELDPEDYEKYGCLCHKKVDCESLDGSEDKLAVALSQDCFHDPIASSVIKLWKDRKWEIRDVTEHNHPLGNAGRAKENQMTNSDHCACEGLIIKPDGKIAMCGCDDAPIVGDIWHGISSDWDYAEDICYQTIKETEAA